MIKFHELAFRNFLSYGNNLTTLNLDFKKPTLIVGNNCDATINGQIDSNGAGKSSILNALCYALYDRGVTNTDKNKLINNINKKNMFVSIVFEKDNTFYKICRFRKNKAMGGDGIQMYKSDTMTFTKEHEKTLDSVNNVNKEIEQILGMPFEIFVRIIVFKASYKSFLTLPVAEQRLFTEELFDIKELSEKADILKEIVKSNKADLNTLSVLNEHILAEHGRLDKQIAGMDTKVLEWNSTQEQTVKTMRDKLLELSTVDFYAQYEKLRQLDQLNVQKLETQKQVEELKKQINSLNSSKNQFVQWNNEHTNKIKTLQDKIDRIQPIDYDAQQQFLKKKQSYSDIIALLNTEQNSVQKTLQTSESALRSKLTEQKHLEGNECPYCSQLFADSKNKLVEVNNDVTKLQIEITSIKDMLVKNNDDMVIAQTRLSEVLLNIVFDTIEQLLNYKNTSEKIIQEYDLLSKSVCPYEDIDDLELQQLIKLYDTSNDELSYISQKHTNVQKSIIYTSEKILMKMENDIDTLEETIKNKQTETNPYVKLRSDLEDTVREPTKTKQIDELFKDIEHKEFLVKLLTKKDSFIRKSLLRKNIDYINSRLKYYLDKIALPHRVVFTEEMGVSISQFKNELDYGGLSDGQMARVNLALSFAFRDVVQAKFGKIDLCILDECLDIGLSNVGVQLAAKMIKQIAIDNRMSMFIISHRDELTNMFDEKLEVELRNGISRIVSGKMLVSEIIDIDE